MCAMGIVMCGEFKGRGPDLFSSAWPLLTILKYFPKVYKLVLIMHVSYSSVMMRESPAVNSLCVFIICPYEQRNDMGVSPNSVCEKILTADLHD